MAIDVVKIRRLFFELFWHVVVLAATVSVASYFHGAPFWRVGDAIQPVYVLCVSYVALAVVLPITRYFKIDGWLLPPAGFAAIGGLYFLWLLLSGGSYDKLDVLATFGLLAAAVSLFYLFPRFRLLWVGLFATLLAGSVVMLLRPADDKAFEGDSASFVTSSIRTSVYDLEVRTYQGVVPRSRTHMGMGALQKIEDAYVVAMASGEVYSIRGIGSMPSLSVKKWSNRAPLNYDDFLAAGENQSFAIYFRVTDVLLKPGAQGNTLFVAHHHWNVDDACATLRVSSVAFDTLTQLEEEDLAWVTVFDTTPCFQLEDEAWAFRGMEGGGRLALSSSDQLLLTVGDHGFNGVDYDTNWVDDLNTSYGKTIAIHLASGESSVLTIGHRNQQGLLVDEDGIIWSTEHGPEGGDELNVLIQGGLYGWPNLTYGTDYGKLDWPVARPEEDSIYTLPVFAWLPAIGVSNLTVVRGSLFDRWESDLLVASLVAGTMYRVHIEDGAVRFVEPIRLNERIRDLVADDNGIIIWADSRSLIQIVPDS